MPDADASCSAAGAKSQEYPDIPAILRLAGRAPQHPKSPTYFYTSPKDKNHCNFGEGRPQRCRRHYGVSIGAKRFASTSGQLHQTLCRSAEPPHHHTSVRLSATSRLFEPVRNSSDLRAGHRSVHSKSPAYKTMDCRRTALFVFR